MNDITTPRLVDITMPRLGETVVEGTIIRWFKQEGDTVEVDEVLFEVSTDKVDTEVPSPVAGVVREILIGEGEDVEVGQVLARVGDTSVVAPPPADPPMETLSAVAGRSETAPPPLETPSSAVAGRSEAALPPIESSAVAGRSEAALPPIESSAVAGRSEITSPIGESTVRAAPGLVISPLVRRLIADNNLDPTAIRGTGAGGRITRSDVEQEIRARVSAGRLGVGTREERGLGESPAAEAVGLSSPTAVAGDGRRADVGGSTPEAESLPSDVGGSTPEAESLPSDVGGLMPEAESLPSDVRGSMPDTESRRPSPRRPSDVSSLRPSPPRPSQPQQEPEQRRSTHRGSLGDDDQVIPLNNIRKRTAEHMVMSKRTAPHVLTAVEVDYEAVERARRPVREAWKAEEGFSLTYLPFIARAVIDALREYPHMNASFGDGELMLHSRVNLAVAVDIDFQGLLAPVIRGADGKRLRLIAREIANMAERARSLKLRPDDLSAGTFTLTNAGSYGTMLQFPIINQPQVAIISTDGISRKPVVVDDGSGGEAIAVHSVGVLAMAWDHRAFDGAYAAAFLNRVRQIIETRDWQAEIR